MNVRKINCHFPASDNPLPAADFVVTMVLAGHRNLQLVSDGDVQWCSPLVDLMRHPVVYDVAVGVVVDCFHCHSIVDMANVSSTWRSE